MARHLNEDVSYCELDGRLYFLDIKQDRYFQLSKTLEHDFLRYISSPNDADLDISSLVRHNLLSDAATTSHLHSDLGPARQSLLESYSSGRRIPLGTVLDVFMSVSAMRWQLRTRSLKAILQMLTQYRRHCTSQVARDEAGIRKHLTEAATAFNRVRPYVPIETCCLIDSLSMIRFLAKQGVPAQLVMGITRDPFSAHAWVQYGPLVLNDTVGNAQAHVPIRVI